MTYRGRGRPRKTDVRPPQGETIQSAFRRHLANAAAEHKRKAKTPQKPTKPWAMPPVRLQVRLSPSLHARLKREASKSNRSLNSQIELLLQESEADHVANLQQHLGAKVVRALQAEVDAAMEK